LSVGQVNCEQSKINSNKALQPLLQDARLKNGVIPVQYEIEFVHNFALLSDLRREKSGVILMKRSALLHLVPVIPGGCRSG